MTPAQRRSSAAWLRAQLEGMRWTATLRAIPQPELLRMLEAVLLGEDFRAEVTR